MELFLTASIKDIFKLLETTSRCPSFVVFLYSEVSWDTLSSAESNPINYFSTSFCQCQMHYHILITKYCTVVKNRPWASFFNRADSRHCSLQTSLKEKTARNVTTPVFTVAGTTICNKHEGKIIWLPFSFLLVGYLKLIFQLNLHRKFWNSIKPQ